jgi:DNA repair protein RadC
VRLFRGIVPDHVREHFLALYLGARHRPIGFRVIATGTADQALIHPREVFQAGILLGATALIVAHNHPSGDPSPSAEDQAITDRLQKAGELLGVRLLDSIVFAESGQWARIEPKGGAR